VSQGHKQAQGNNQDRININHQGCKGRSSRPTGQGRYSVSEPVVDDYFADFPDMMLTKMAVMGASVWHGLW
jgi:hypothetical protein